MKWAFVGFADRAAEAGVPERGLLYQGLPGGPGVGAALAGAAGPAPVQQHV
jgi:hypothetical protein